jgi:peptidoglycan/LPS O-acetylase OafA/YrhL
MSDVADMERNRTPDLPRHMPALDGLRGVAILMVLLTHCWGGWQAALSARQDTLAMLRTFALPWWADAIAGQAYHDVALFFVVSAFTLTIQAGRRHDSWLAYAVRRMARVGPGYWLAGLGYTLAAGLAPRLWAPDGVTLPDLGIAATFGSAWQGGASGTMARIPSYAEIGISAIMPTSGLCRSEVARPRLDCFFVVVSSA